jgi:hypothetical protein
MNDYAVGRDKNDAEPPGPFVVGRGVRMNYQVLVKDDAGAWVPLNIDGPRWSVRVRAFAAGAAATTRDEECTKSTNGASTGWIDHYFACGTTVYASALQWELVLVDADNPDASTKTTTREYILLQFREPITAAPRT